MNKVFDDTVYAYAVGRVRSLETNLLDQGRFERMIEAPSVQEALKVLAESHYASALADLATSLDFEEMLGESLKSVFALILGLAPRPALIAMLALRYDLHNLKVLLKAHFLGVKSELLIPVGTLDLTQLAAAVNEEDFRDLPSGIREAVEETVEDFSLRRDPQAIDLNLDRALYASLQASARAEGSSYLLRLFKIQVDLVNIKTLLRVQRMGLDRDFLKKGLLPGGNLDGDRLLGVLEESPDSLINVMAMSEYAELVAEGVRAWVDSGSAARLEKLSDDYVTAYLGQGKWTPFGPEPLIGYLWAREMEMKNIRLVMVGKINRLPAAAIRGRLRNVYI